MFLFDLRDFNQRELGGAQSMYRPGLGDAAVRSGESVTDIASFNFSTDRLGAPRPRGISGFMRIRNGAEFLETTVRSHIDFYDELVAVYNQCSDETPEILRRLRAEYGPKLRIYHYLPRVFPPGSIGHAREAPNSPHSFVNMSNCALSLTRFSIASKLDDDHLAMDGAGWLPRKIRAMHCSLDRTLCVSGINIAVDEDGKLGIPAYEPFVGSGDQGYFEVSPQTHFSHDPRFERLQYGAARRTFAGFAYWHLKYLKIGFGFANREVEAGQNPRFERKLRAFSANRKVLTTSEIRFRARLQALLLSILPISEKLELRAERNWSFCQDDPGDDQVFAAWRAIEPSASASPWVPAGAYEHKAARLSGADPDMMAGSHAVSGS